MSTGVFPYRGKRGVSWYYRIRIKGQKPIKRGGLPTKWTAEDARKVELKRLREARAETIWGVRDTVAALHDVPTVASYIEQVYLPGHVATLAETSQGTLRSMCKFLTLLLGPLKLYECRPPVLDEYVAIRRGLALPLHLLKPVPGLRGVGASKVRDEINRLSYIMNHARRKGVLDAHPFPRYRRPKPAPRDIRPVTRDEERRLLKKATRKFGEVITTALFTGLRKGELRILEEPMVNWARRELRLQQPKTGHVKVIPLEAPILRLFRRLRRPGVRYLFAKRNGARYSLGWYDWEWRATCRRAGLKGIRFHDLRHTFATRSAESGRFSLGTLGEILGHKWPYKTTLRYFHVDAEAKRLAMRRLYRAWWRGPKSGPKSIARR